MPHVEVNLLHEALWAVWEGGNSCLSALNAELLFVTAHLVTTWEANQAHEAGRCPSATLPAALLLTLQ